MMDLTLGAEGTVAAVKCADLSRLGGRSVVYVVHVAHHVPQLRRDELAGRVRTREGIWTARMGQIDQIHRLQSQFLTSFRVMCTY